jgi:hypothetical protein
MVIRSCRYIPNNKSLLNSIRSCMMEKVVATFCLSRQNEMLQTGEYTWDLTFHGGEYEGYKPSGIWCHVFSLKYTDVSPVKYQKDSCVFNLQALPANPDSQPPRGGSGAMHNGSPEDGDRSSLWNVVFLKTMTMDNVQKLTYINHHRQNLLASCVFQGKVPFLFTKTNICWRVHTMKPLVQFSLSSCYFHPSFRTFISAQLSS